MTYIDVYQNCCYYREFIETSESNISTPHDKLYLMVYNDKNKKFYQKTLTASEWMLQTTNFTLSDLESIFKVCFTDHTNYILKVEIKNEDMHISITCREVIKTYYLNIILQDKCTTEIETINSLFSNFRNYIKTEAVVGMPEIEAVPDTIDNSDNMTISLFYLEKKIKKIFKNREKEMLMMPYIVKLNKVATENCHSADMVGGTNIIPEKLLSINKKISYLDSQVPINKLLKKETDNTEKKELTKMVLDYYDNLKKQMIYIEKEMNVIKTNSVDMESLEQSESRTSSSHSAADELSLSTEDPKYPAIGYQTFIKNKIQELRSHNPDLYQTQYEQTAHLAWLTLNGKK